ncbi:MAG TPA: hypothetical protein VGR15_09900 [Bacteroidota bacterium]|jgi:hypothetical protein|nr:hypothetical protein [Bacteroidota bacterium]
MKRSFLRSSWFMVTMMALIVAISAGLWTGCGEKQETAMAPPTTDQHPAILDKTHPQVISVAAVQERHTPELMANKLVVGTGIGLDQDGKLAILVLTKEEGVHNIPSTLEGIPTRVQVVGEVRAMANTKTYRPVPCGVSVGNDKECASGTIGCVVLKGSTRCALSNNHVFARENAGSNGERIDQPGRYDGKPKCAQTGQIGTLAGFVTINFSGGNNTVDCAIAQYTTDNVCSMIGGTYTPSSTTVSASVGLPVKKTGRTSGETHGAVSGINVTINVDYGSAGVAHFVNQIMVDGSFIRSGDSGSLMVTDNASANPVGLCFAGGGGASFANPIGPVLQGLGVSVCSQ